MKLKVKTKGSFDNTERFLRKASTFDLYRLFEKYGKKGVDALSVSTPKDTGNTSEKWSYNIEKHKHSVKIYWSNSNRNDGVSIAIILQYGHATKNGGYVEGTDYINPAMKSVFDDILKEIQREVKSW